MTEIIMSIKPQYVDKILSGEKTVELRSRRLRIQDGSRLWIYSTLPKGCIEVTATIKSVVYADPDTIWVMYAKQLAITEHEFKVYVNGNKIVSALILENIMKVDSPVTLDLIRSSICDFHPPQFFSYVKSGMGLSDLLTRESFTQTVVF